MDVNATQLMREAVEHLHASGDGEEYMGMLKQLRATVYEVMSAMFWEIRSKTMQIEEGDAE